MNLINNKVTIRYYLVALLSTSFWLLFFLMGFTKESVNDEYLISSEEFLNKNQELFSSRSQSFFLIFNNNIKACTYNVIGFLTLGISTLSNLALNGFEFGLFLNYFLSKFSLSEFLERFIPHSAELIGFWLSGAVGLEISYLFFASIFLKKIPNKTEIKILVSSAIIILILIFLSALIEAYYSFEI